ncbi:MAG: CHASE4 domain-containing protein [Desulfuromonadaceae bacterium]|nr:CHASE4 domain-containing protein [Desulfuromonadaceae bacterium]
MSKYFQLIAFVFAILVGILLFISPINSLHNFSMIEQGEVSEDTLQARNIINEEVQQLYITAGDYAGWDDTYAFMQDGNPKFISSSLGESFYSKLRLNIFCLVANDGKMVFGIAHDYHQNIHTAVPPSLSAHFKSWNLLLKNIPQKEGLRGLLSLPEGLLMVVARPILTSEDKGPPRGTLIIGRFLDPSVMSHISNLLNYRIEALNYVSNSNNPDFMDRLPLFTNHDMVLIRPGQNNNITGYAQLVDIYGKVAGLVRLEKPRTIYHEAQQSTWILILLYGLMCFAVTSLFIPLRNKLTIVNRNEQEIKDQLHSFIELAIDGFFSISSTGEILKVNSRVCHMTGYSRDELQEMHFGELFKTNETMEPLFGKLLLENGNKGDEQILVGKDGQHNFVELTSKNLPDGTIQCFMHDVSAYKAMEQKLIEYHNKVNSMAIEVSLAEERERNRIASELHDQVGPNLLLGKLKIDQLQARFPDTDMEEDFEEINEFINKSIHDIRSLTFQLRPPILANAGLEAALRWLGQEFEQQHGIKVSVHHDDAPFVLEYGISVTLFQSVRELLLNVVKHASAKKVCITLDGNPGTLVIIVEDDGIGFSLPHDHAVHSDSFGLFNMQQKIKYHGGHMHIDSVPGRGTRVFITMPFTPEIST